MKRWTRKRMSVAAALCLELGAGLLENGAETSRVEESIRMAGLALSMEIETMVTPTGITVSFGDGESVTRVARIKERAVDLHKVAELNRLSREIRGGCDLETVRKEIESIRTAPSLYSEPLRIASTALSCFCLTLVFGGAWTEALVAVTAACSSSLILGKFGSGFPSFLSRFFLGFVSTAFAVVAAQFWGLGVEAIVVGSLLHQMPGLAFVSAMRDLMAGELTAGNARLAEAVLVALGMASGVVAGLTSALRLGLQVSL